MRLLWDERVWNDYLYWQKQDKKTLRRINTLIKDILREWAVIWDAREEGAYLKVIEQVCIKLRKGFDSKRIAEELEEDPSKIEEIIKIADRFKPEYN